jgi:hypothetical protein
MTLPYTKDQLDDAFIAGQRSVNSHDKMSDETKQQFKIMGEEITQLKVTSTRIETKVDNIIDTLKSHIAEESEYRKNQDIFHKEIMEKKANVWVEKAISGVVIFILTAVGGALLSLIILK